MSIEFLRTTPEAQGIPSDAVAEVIGALDKLDFMKGIIMLRHGRIVAEAYWKPFDPHTPQALWSLSKSFTSCAIGLAQSEKLLNVRDCLIDFFPEYRSCVQDEKMFKVTLQDLLTMRSGHDQCAFVYATADSAGDWVRGFLSSPLKYEPGTCFVYNSCATYMLSAVIRRLTGLNVREYLMPRLFEPLGITPGVWETCPAGTDCGGVGFHLNIMDIAKFAQVVLDKGRWNGKQLLPADYLEEALLPHADNSMNALPDWKCGYGYQFWSSRYGKRGDGACGQYAIMLPEQDMAIAVLASMNAMHRVLEILWEKLLPALKETPLEEDKEACAQLGSVCSSLSVPTLEKGVDAGAKKCTFTFIPNAAHIEEGALETDGKSAVLSFKTARGSDVIRAGFGHWEISTVQLLDSRAHAVAGSACWKDENTLEIYLIYLDSTFRDTWTLKFQNGTVCFDWKTVCSLLRPAVPPLAVKELISE